MGVVYRATDTNLKREVAIKVLPEAVAHDGDRLARFEREARTLAALNHPNIAIVHGLEKADVIRALVMELVEGPTLADRIAAGPIPIDDSLLIARQIVDALEAAHDQGIIHRDLKPSNIKVKPDGMVKVLDFGLAKAMDTPGTSSSLVSSPTITTPAMTQMGVILGTAAYMSPEQARGKPADRRSDIWAFGCVLYEMLTSRRAFNGEEVSDTLAAVLRADVEWTRLPAATSTAVRRLLERCLAKDPKRRLQHIGDARLELDEHDSKPPQVPGGSTRRPARVWQLVVAGLAGAAIIGVTDRMLTPDLAPAPVRRFTIPIASQAALSTTQNSEIVLSPDGRTLVLSSGPTGLVKRRLDGLSFEPIRGAEGGTSPFFSPDGAWIGFQSDLKLKKVPAEGGLATTICDLPKNPGPLLRAAWSDGGTIVVSSGGDLFEVSAAGGTLTSFLESDGEPFTQPAFVPRLNVLLVGRGRPGGTQRIEAIDMKTRTAHPLLGGAAPQIAATGDLVFEQGGGIWAVGFDVEQLAIVGAPVPVVESVGSSFVNLPLFSTSRDGSLAYVSGDVARNRSVVWLDRTGNASPALAEPGAFQSPRLSPDGKRLAVSVGDASNLDVWNYDLERGTGLRLTTSDRNRRSVWSSDGAQIAFYSTPSQGGDQELYVVPSTGGEPKRLLTRPGLQYPDAWSPDGRTMIFEEETVGTSGRDLWVLPIGESPKPLLVTRFNERGAVLSRDGRWLAYVSNESGRAEIYVQPFPGPGGKVPISTNGGLQPMWSRDGRELFYRAGDSLMAVPIERETFRIGARNSNAR
jgi:Tol biopolymer transport system component